MKVTRRALAASLGAAALAAQTTAQTPPQAAAPDAELQAARDRVKANTLLLSAQQVPITMEPAFAFKP